MNEIAQVLETLERIAAALERRSPVYDPVCLPADVNAFIWQTDPDAMLPVTRINRLSIALLKGIEP